MNNMQCGCPGALFWRQELVSLVLFLTLFSLSLFLLILYLYFTIQLSITLLVARARNCVCILYVWIKPGRRQHTILDRWPKFWQEQEVPRHYRALHRVHLNHLQDNHPCISFSLSVFLLTNRHEFYPSAIIECLTAFLLNKTRTETYYKYCSIMIYRLFELIIFQFFLYDRYLNIYWFCFIDRLWI